MNMGLSCLFNLKTFAAYKKKIPDIVKAEEFQKDYPLCCEAEELDDLPFLDEEPMESEKKVRKYTTRSASRKKK